MKKLSVIIVNYNVCYFLEQALKSVFNSRVNFEYDVWVVDNNSADHSLEMVADLFPQVQVIANKKNVGFSKANNQGVFAGKSEYVLLLNPDTVLEEDTLQKCVDCLENDPKVGALGVKMVDGKGVYLPESKRGLPTPSVAFYKISGLSKLFPKSERFGRYHLGFLDKDKDHEIEVLAGAFMMIRKNVYEQVGGLDEDYFMYGEDIDLSYKITQAGYKNMYLASTKIIHYKGESTKKASVKYVFVFYKAMIIFAKKHFTKNQALLFSSLIYFAIYLKAGVEIIKNIFRRFLHYAIDFSFVYFPLLMISKFWEKTYKAQLSTKYPEIFFNTILPAYIVVWLLSNYLSGGDDRPYKTRNIIRGILVGTFLISGVSNFIDQYRFSKGLILIGALVSVLVFISSRLIRHYLEFKNWSFSKEPLKRVALIGSTEEILRVEELISIVNPSMQVVGQIALDQNGDYHKNSLGLIDKLDELIKMYHLDELVFCSKDISYSQIINIMTEKGEAVDFKIVPSNSQYLIGSNSKDHPGTYYALEIKFNLNEVNHRRNKRVFDLIASLLVFLSSPILVFFVKQKIQLFKNTLSVLFGSKTWVGFSIYNSTLPKLKKGILGTFLSSEEQNVDSNILKRSDFLYAKDYSFWKDIEIVFHSIVLLGNK